MKALWLSKNRRGRRGAPRLSLFPFLAVLICTMGALMILLLLVTRQARLQAARDAAAKDAEKQSSIAAEMEMVKWRVDQLKKSRKETEAQLADARLRLGHIEDHSRRLRGQFQDLSDQAKKASAEGLKPGRFVAAGEEELRQIERQIAEAQQRLAQAQQASATRPKSYAIVPYDGPNHTRRRPIYIECRGDSVVLQPENIVFTDADFDEPLGPGNPLAAAVRAAREQMLLQGSADPQNAGEPYPLLLVRPAGIASYDAALGAMKSWGSEFGYELINEDWQLSYPPANPSVARAVAEAVLLARQEHARLIAAAPSKYGKHPRAGSFRSPTGSDGSGEGGAGEGGAGEGGSPGFYSSKPSERYAHSAAGGGSSGGSHGDRGGRFGGSGDAGGNGASGSDHGDNDGPSGDAEFAANNPYAALPAPGSAGAGDMRAGGPGNGGGYPGGYGGGNGPAGGNGGTGYGPGGAPTSGVASFMGGSPAGSPGGGNPGGSQGSGIAGSPGGSPNMNPGGGNANDSQSTAANGAGSNPAGVAASNSASVAGQYATQSTGQTAAGSPSAPPERPDGYINGRPDDAAPKPAPVRPDPSNVAMAHEIALRPGEWRPSEEPPKRDREAEEKEKKEKKKHRYDKAEFDHTQDDWGLRNSTRHAAAISRPIHVDCYPDRIVLIPEAGSGEPRVIICDAGGARDADRLVAAVWEIMDTWGMAGRGMYWRPVLNFYVVPGAEPRLLDLSRSLQGSGLVIERKQ